MAESKNKSNLCTIHYLGHSAWLIEGKGQAWLFDYGQLPERDRELDLAGLGQVKLFFSHLHQDHWQEKLASQALDQGRQVFLGLSSLAERPTGLAGLITMLPRTSYSDGQMTVWASGSTDQGVSFLIKQDSLFVYHGGDLAVWDDTRAYREGYRTEVDWLASRLGAGQRPLVAFLPVSTSDGYQEEPLLEGLAYIIDRLRPHYVLPMHAHAHEHLYGSFAAWLAQGFQSVGLLQADQADVVFQLDLKDQVQDQA